ncbi:hypothetical protein GCM10023196_043510 [Actinoallomurus vinaceus]|uniref:Transposase n=1 Tax=Actinoallomurus vinaceus TaxID=1080074 RepID=A0ABP8UBB3_9ACTN
MTHPLSDPAGPEDSHVKRLGTSTARNMLEKIGVLILLTVRVCGRSHGATTNRQVCRDKGVIEVAVRTISVMRGLPDESDTYRLPSPARSGRRAPVRQWSSS